MVESAKYAKGKHFPHTEEEGRKKERMRKIKERKKNIKNTYLPSIFHQITTSAPYLSSSFTTSAPDLPSSLGAAHTSDNFEAEKDGDLDAKKAVRRASVKDLASQLQSSSI